ncbi:ATP-dependent zinc protease family protein [Aliamphritea hakodatensis]|uniref:ATP-dependent zinc protease family protein n=1 Tax=Aliamphritea hakodatensis TaxID=2895352 RepID=UPI0022FD4575|nr:RimK/LysX family protein [Aliamphritea hakodatensis]
MMRGLCLLLSVFILGGCIATRQFQEETNQLAAQAAEQCSNTQTRMDEQFAAQNKVLKALQRETQALQQDAKDRQAMIVAASAEQSCGQLRKSLNNKTVVGAVEWSQIDYGSHQSVAKARMDTGATTSSISARNISEFERNGERWVRFTLADDEEVSLKLVRYANIRQASSQKDKRWVVKLGIKLGNITQIAEFTLKDRSHLNYDVLVGRNLLKDLMVVDVARRYVLGKKPELAVNIPPAN